MAGDRRRQFPDCEIANSLLRNKHEVNAELLLADWAKGKGERRGSA
jgi:hypothetical protein